MLEANPHISWGLGQAISLEPVVEVVVADTTDVDMDIVDMVAVGMVVVGIAADN